MAMYCSVADGHELD